MDGVLRHEVEVSQAELEDCLGGRRAPVVVGDVARHVAGYVVGQVVRRAEPVVVVSQLHDHVLLHIVARVARGQHDVPA